MKKTTKKSTMKFAAPKAIADMTNEELDRAQEEAAARGDMARHDAVFDELVKRGLRVDYRTEGN